MSAWTVQAVDPADTSLEPDTFEHEDGDLIEIAGPAIIRLGHRDGIPAVQINVSDVQLVATADPDLLG